MQKVIVRYSAPAGEPARELVVAIGPAEDMRAKRELAIVAGADDEYALFYRAFLACRRAGDVGQAVKFDQWLETIESVEPRLSMEDIDTAERIGRLPAAEAEILRERVRELGDVDQGESQTPRD